MDNKRYGKVMTLSLCFLLVGACFLIGLGTAAAEASVSVSPQSIDDLSAGDTFDVTVELNSDNSALKGVEMFLNFDPDVLQIDHVTKSYENILDPTIFATATRADNSAGKVDYQVATNSPSPTAGTFLTVSFEVVDATASGTYPLDLEVRLFDGDSEEITATVNDGAVSIIASETTETSDETTDTTSSQSGFGTVDTTEDVVEEVETTAEPETIAEETTDESEIEETVSAESEDSEEESEMVEDETAKDTPLSPLLTTFVLLMAFLIFQKKEQK